MITEVWDVDEKKNLFMWYWIFAKEIFHDEIKCVYRMLQAKKNLVKYLEGNDQESS